MFVVTIVGPIASGKSTVARFLGERLRRDGLEVAVADLDDVVEAVGGFDRLTPARFRSAQLVLGDLVGAWLERGINVIAHGPFFHRDEEDAVLHAVPRDVGVHRVRLLTTYDVALQRVSTDPDRRLSKDPDLLRATYDRAAAL